MAKKPHKYCGKDDGDDWLALDACASTCGTCGCEDSDTWLYKGKSGKVSVRLCSFRVCLMLACVFSCAPANQQHALPWSTSRATDSNTSTPKSCDYVAKKPSKYCDSEDDDGTTAAEAW